VCFFHLHTRLRVHLAPGFPCALFFSGRMVTAQLGRYPSRENVVSRHCFSFSSWPGFVPAIHVFGAVKREDVDARDI
jgi:hypothetical protein